MKRISFLIILLLLFLVIGCTNDEPGTTGLQYSTLDDGTYGVSVGLAKDIKRIVIPSKCDGIKVTKIMPEGFEKCNAEEIIIPKSVTSIGGGAFYGCKLLKSIKIPDGVTSLGGGVFYRCESLTDIIIPNSLKEFSEQLSYCEKLHYNEYNNGLYLGNNDNKYVVLVKMIDKECSNFEVHQKTKVICEEVFYDCKLLTNISIPETITYMHSDIWSKKPINWCNKLQYNEYKNGLYLGNDKNKYVVFVKATNNDFEINENAKLIVGSAFAGRNLTNIIIPGGITSICKYAFYQCEVNFITFKGSKDKWNSFGIVFQNCEISCNDGKIIYKEGEKYNG